ncbi:MAG: 2-C-methyl-D-erythritol 2,4-cyclodiphosphate synthase [Candidatus Omnitrophota bacterium]
MEEYRTGIGYDIHRLAEGRKLILGGIEIPYPKGLLGHSDGDTLLHAIADALLGATAEGDIGEHFPNTDPKYRDIDSVIILKNVLDLISRKGFRINNVDTVIVAQEPALSPFKKDIRKRIAAILGIAEDAVGIKAKTNEELGELGRKEAIAAYAVVNLSRGER